MVMQGVGGVLGGTIAKVLGRGTTGVGRTIATLAVLPLIVTITLTRGLRRSHPNDKERQSASAGDMTDVPT